MKFLLLLTLFGADGPDYEYAINTNLSAVECEQQLEEQQALLEKSFDVNDFELWCEQDDAYED